MGSLKDAAKDVTENALDFVSGGGYGQGKKKLDELTKLPEMPASPVLAKEAVMPIPDDEASKAAKRRALAAQRQRGGRQSTILSALGNETLG